MTAAVTHDVPVGRHGLTSCCRRRAEDLPDDARLTEEPELITCAGDEPAEEGSR